MMLANVHSTLGKNIIHIFSQKLSDTIADNIIRMRRKRNADDEKNIPDSRN